MKSSQLMYCLKADPITDLATLGVFARDKVPSRIPGGYGLIMNTHTSDKEGEHWLALYNNGSRLELFDSYGRTAKQWNLQNMMEMPTRLQGSMSAVCGQYCLYYLYHRLRDVKIVDVYSNFGYNYLENDELVCNFVNQVYDMNTDVYDEDIIVNQLSTMLIKC